MEDNEAVTAIFLSGDKFYLWERMGDEVYEIVSRDIRDIALVISQSDLRASQKTSCSNTVGGMRCLS